MTAVAATVVAWEEDSAGMAARVARVAPRVAAGRAAGRVAAGAVSEGHVAWAGDDAGATEVARELAATMETRVGWMGMHSDFRNPSSLFRGHRKSSPHPVLHHHKCHPKSGWGNHRYSRWGVVMVAVMAATAVMAAVATVAAVASPWRSVRYIGRRTLKP